MDKNELKTWVKRHVSGIDRKRLLPVSHTKGMRDFVACELSAGDRYPDFYEAVLDSSTLKPGGYLEYDPLENGSISSWVCCTEDDFWIYAEAAMEAYDKYLCSDGKIRYSRTEESDALYDKLHENNEAEFWRDIDAAFAEMGMYYDEEKGCYVNPETGEEGYY